MNEVELCKSCEGSGVIDLDWHLIADCKACEGTGESMDVDHLPKATDSTEST